MSKKLLLLALFCSIGYAQEQSYNIVDFSSGLDSTVSEYAIPKNKAVIANDIRFGDVYGGISKREGMLSFGTLGSSTVMISSLTTELSEL